MVKPGLQLWKTQEGWGFCANKPAYGLLSLYASKTSTPEDAAFLLAAWSPVPQDSALLLCDSGMSCHTARQLWRSHQDWILLWNPSTSTKLVSPQTQNIKHKTRDPVTAAADQQQEGKPRDDGQVNLI